MQQAKLIYLSMILGAIGFGVLVDRAAAANETRNAATNANGTHWSSLITAEELHERLENKDLLIIDARSPAEYAAGHIEGAINLPGADWRTPAAEPGSGKVGQQIFRRADGGVDVARYEEFLSDAGITPQHEIVVYGNFAGKADGSVPAAILLKLGHEKVLFLDGVGLDEWKSAGYEVSTVPNKLPPSKYTARPELQRFWSYEDVLKNIDNPDVVFIDSRTPQEFAAVRGVSAFDATSPINDRQAFRLASKALANRSVAPLSLSEAASTDDF